MDDKQLFTPEQVASLLNNADVIKRARIFEAGTQRPFSVQKMTLSLTTEQLETNPLKIGFPFRSVWVQTATDSNVSINIKIGSRDTVQSEVPLKLNDSFPLDYPTSEGYLYWTAQSGKSITLVFFTDAEFRPGSIISVQSGGVSIVTGTSFTRARVTLSAATAAAIFTADTTRKNGTAYNATGADLWVGDSAITNSGSTQGILWPAGSIFEWKNTAALYGYSVAGGDVITISET